MPETKGKIRLVSPKHPFTEFCEGCSTVKEGVKDIELQSAKSGRQILHTFLCPPCREEAAAFFTEAAK